MTFALTAYPASQTFRGELERLYGPVTYHSIPELRRLPARKMLARLRAHRGELCLLPLEDPTSRPLAPLLAGVALLASPGRIELVTSEGERTTVSKVAAAASGARLLAATIDGRRALRRAGRELNELRDERRVEVTLGDLHETLYLNANLWFGVTAGGSVGHTAGVVNALSDRGAGVALATMTPPPLLRDNVSLLSLLPPTAYGLPVEVNHYRFQHQIAPQVLDQLQSKPELLYQRMSVANYAGVTLSRRLRVPLVLEYNGSEVWAARHWGTPLKYEEAALAAEDVSLRHAHLVVTVSSVLGDELRERGVDPRRLVVYPNGVDPVQYDPERFTEANRAALRARYDVPPDALVVGFIGTFGAWHGVERLAEAIRLLVDETPDWVERNRVYFMLVGDGLRMREVSAMLAPPAYARFVRLPGLVSQSEGALHLAASDVLVSPHVPNANGSPFFGSPTKLFEYMAMGRAIVASDLNQIGEVLRAGGEPVAVLTPPGDPRAIADAIRQLVERPELRDQLGQKARQLVLDRFTWERHVEAIMGQAHDVIGAS